MNAALTSSEKMDWGTPRWLFEILHREFEFTVDVCAHSRNAKLERYWSEADDGLVQPWLDERCWMNPPYGGAVSAWTRKARYEARTGALVVGLLPARTDTTWWHRDVMAAREVRLLRGRLTFEGAPSTAPFPSVVVVWSGRWLSPLVRSWDPVSEMQGRLKLEGSDAA